MSLLGPDEVPPGPNIQPSLCKYKILAVHISEELDDCMENGPEVFAISKTNQPSGHCCIAHFGCCLIIFSCCYDKVDGIYSMVPITPVGEVVPVGRPISLV